MSIAMPTGQLIVFNLIKLKVYQSISDHDLLDMILGWTESFWKRKKLKFAIKNEEIVF